MITQSNGTDVDLCRHSLYTNNAQQNYMQNKSMPKNQATTADKAFSDRHGFLMMSYHE